MKKLFDQTAYWSGVVVLGLVLGLSIQFVRAWTEPTDAPPNGNVGAPINTSSITQLKNGVLGLVGLSTSYIEVPGSIPVVGNTLQVRNVFGSSAQLGWGSGGGGEGAKAFVGATSGKYDGAGVGGYDGGDAKCDNEYPGSRMCANFDFTVGRPTKEGWFSTFGSYAISTSDCQGWTSNNGGSLYANRWRPATKSNWLTYCSESFPILCCK